MSIDHKSDIINLYALFILSVGTIYFAPRVISVLLQIVFLISFYRSKKDYFWLALVFIIENFPGAFFSRYTSDIQHTFSLLPDSPVGTLYFWMVFILVAFFKALQKKRNYKFIFKENIQLLFAYFLFLILIFGLYKITAVTRTLLPWSFLLILPRLLKKEEDFVGFFNLIFSFVFIIIFTQIFQLIFSTPIATIFGGSNLSLLTAELEVVARPTDGIFIPFLALFGGIYYIILGKKYFSRNYLISIIGLSLFSIFITATRSWLIASLFIFAGYYFLISKEKSIVLKRFAIPVLIFLLLIPFVPILNQQIDLSLQRYETIGSLLKGDITAGGTLQRLDVRAPRVMAKFYESPIFGWGFGDEANKYRDEHVGNQNLLMQTGIIGFILWFLLWANFILKMQKLNKSITPSNPYKNIPQIFILMLIGILFIHSSSQWFSYLLGFLPGFTIIFLLTFASFVNKKALEEEKLLHNSKIGSIE